MVKIWTFYPLNIESFPLSHFRPCKRILYMTFQMVASSTLTLNDEQERINGIWNSKHKFNFFHYIFLINKGENWIKMLAFKRNRCIYLYDTFDRPLAIWQLILELDYICRLPCNDQYQNHFAGTFHQAQTSNFCRVPDQHQSSGL